MNTELERLIKRHVPSRLLLDANLLLLAVVGACDLHLIERFKRTNAFTTSDYRVLEQVIMRLGRVVTTPHVLAEVSNLLFNRDKLTRRDPIWDDLVSTFLRKLDVTQWKEEYRPASEISRSRLFRRFGLTDTGLAIMVEGGALLMSTDSALVAELRGRDLPAVNFNHIRDFEGD